MKRRTRPVGCFLFVVFFVFLGFLNESMSAKPQADGGRYHTLWVKSDDTLWAWGSNYYGQLGDGTATDRNTLAQVLGNNWVMVSGKRDERPSSIHLNSKGKGKRVADQQGLQAFFCQFPLRSTSNGEQVATAITSDLPSDPFDGIILDTCKWVNRSYNGGQIHQDDELIASTSTDYSVSGAQVLTQYQLTGDFDVQVDFRAGLGWTDPIAPSGSNPHLNAAAMGIFVDEPHWINIARFVGPGGNILGLYSNIPGQGMLASVANEATTGKFRIVRTGSNITFKYDTGMGWQDLHTISDFTTPVYIRLSACSVNTNHAFTTYFDNFLINSGATSYAPLVWNDQFQRRPNFYVGGVVCDYLAGRVWGQYWKQLDPLQTLKENGFTGVRVGVLTTSSQYLRDTPPPEWNTLPWRDEYWSSLEYAEQILREASDKGLLLNLFFFLSDKAAHAGQQDAPAEWVGLSVTDTATVLETYTYNTTQYFLNRGLNIELYDIGNEIEWGILNFRPGERIDLPSGVDVTTNMDYMRNNVWNVEATLLKSAISGVKRADPDAKIVLHIAGLGISPSDLFVKSFFQAMVDEGVEFDYAGLSHPYSFTGWSLPNYSTYCWFQRLQETINFLASLSKKVIFSEAAYPHDLAGIEGGPMEDFPYTPTGQAAWVRDQLRFTSNSENVIGFFYFYPEWFTGMSADSSTLNLQSSGLFASDTQVEPAMDEFRVNLTKHVGIVDFDGDGDSDIGVWRPSNGKWYIQGLSAIAWGVSTDIPVPGDYDGDGDAGIAVWRPSDGKWYIQGQSAVAWGVSTDILVPGDYDGDGTTEIGVWRPSNGRWYIQGMSSTPWGVSTDIPVPGDYDGDGTTDIAVWRPSNGKWYIQGQSAIAWGVSTDIPVPGDYDGDGTTEIAVWRPSNGKWYIQGQSAIAWGVSTDIPVPGDYDGDGDTGIAVWRPSNGRWYIEGMSSTPWGVSGDIPQAQNIWILKQTGLIP